MHDTPELLAVFAAGNDRNDAFTNASNLNTYITYFLSEPSSIPASSWNGSGFYVVNASAVPAPPGDGGNDPGDGSAFGYDTISTFQNLKNGITVGAVEDFTADPANGDSPSRQDLARLLEPADFSSFGPTDDGRLKPEIVAAGVDIRSSDASGGITVTQGTSFAAPAVTGTAALIVERYRERFSETPLAATTKTILVHTATDLGDEEGPDFRFGYGLIDGLAAIDLGSYHGTFEGRERNGCLQH